MGGFLVWNPARGLPTYVHETLDSATAEAERLSNANPGQRFYVMAPVVSEAAARASKAFCHGMDAARAEWRPLVRDAEARLARTLDRLGDLERKLRRLELFEERAREFQAIVADCQLWFDGFDAAHAGREPFERPSTPSRQKLRDLNLALQRAEAAPAEIGKVPF